MKNPFRQLRRRTRKRSKEPFRDSAQYWEERYQAGKTSGRGSYGPSAQFKAEVLNAFVAEQRIQSVIEFGCGDGNQLALAAYPRYVGLDVSRTVIEQCAHRFADDVTKSFYLYDSRAFVDRHGLFRAELALSLDVLLHLVEDDIFERYMNHLFDAATHFVAIYSTNEAHAGSQSHVRHRRFLPWVERHRPDWPLLRKVENPDPPRAHDGGEGSEGEGKLLHTDFYIFQRSA